jgi:hypothetical protein
MAATILSKEDLKDASLLGEGLKTSREFVIYLLLSLWGIYGGNLWGFMGIIGLRTGWQPPGGC